MSDKISTKAGVFESGEKDAQGVQYNGVRLIACRNSKLTEYSVAEGTEAICDRAFMNCKELKSVTLPSSVRVIGESAFSGCRALESINIPEGVTEIRQATFRECDSLQALELPSSCVEIEKYAMGRGLIVLAVNAPAMKIDRYAFMNATGFSTLICPAGSGDYYRSLLAENRINAEVEETSAEDLNDESIKTDNMEENKKTKTISINLFACEKFIDILDKDSCPLEAQSRFSAEDFMEWTVVEDGEYKEYSESDFGCIGDLENEEEFYDKAAPALDVMEFINGVEDADYAELNTLKSSGYMEIEIPADEHFDPKKFCIVAKDWIYPDYEEQMIYGVVYDGKFYDDFFPEDGRGVSTTRIWSVNTKKDTNSASDEKPVEGKNNKKITGLTRLMNLFNEDEEALNVVNSDDTNDDNEPEERKEGWGFINRQGEFVVNPRYDDAKNFEGEIACVRIGKKWGYINRQGDWIVKPKFDDTFSFVEDIARVKVDGKWGYINLQGEFVIEPKFSFVDYFIDGIARVTFEGNKGFINRNGDWVIEPRFNYIHEFKCDLAFVEVDEDMTGYLNRQGKFAIDPKFAWGKDFSEDIAAVSAGKKWGYINPQGDWVIQPKFDRTENFVGGIAAVYIEK